MTWGIDCVIEYRGVLALSVSAVGGTLGLRPYPFPADHAALALVHLELPVLFAELTNMHAALWFSLSFVLPSIGSSWLYTNGRPQPPHSRHRTASTEPALEQREDLFVVLGEQHYRTSSARRAAVVAHDSGTRYVHWSPRCRRHWVGQDIGLHVPLYRSTPLVSRGDPARKVTGLVLEVKGTSAARSTASSSALAADADYVEVSLDSPYRHNPLHDDLDAYALAYGIATLMTNLFGRGKEHESGQVRGSVAPGAR